MGRDDQPQRGVRAGSRRRTPNCFIFAGAALLACLLHIPISAGSLYLLASHRHAEMSFAWRIAAVAAWLVFAGVAAAVASVTKCALGKTRLRRHVQRPGDDGDGDGDEPAGVPAKSTPRVTWDERLLRGALMYLGALAGGLAVVLPFQLWSLRGGRDLLAQAMLRAHVYHAALVTFALALYVCAASKDWLVAR